MEVLRELVEGVWGEDFERVGNGWMIGMLYFVLFVILLVEKGLVGGGFLGGESLVVLVGVLIGKGGMG